jgi:hypothetical protein
MNRILFSWLFFVTSFISCKEDSNTKNYYPVQAWVAAELKNIDSLNLAITHISGDQHDSADISGTDFKQIALGLFSVDFTNKNTRDAFVEEVLDEGDNTNISITYLANEKSKEPLKKIQVNIKPGQSSPKSIYAERTDITDKTIISRKIIWESGHSLTVASAYYQNKQLIRAAKEKFEW